MPHQDEPVIVEQDAPGAPTDARLPHPVLQPPLMFRDGESATGSDTERTIA